MLGFVWSFIIKFFSVPLNVLHGLLISLSPFSQIVISLSLTKSFCLNCTLCFTAMKFHQYYTISVDESVLFLAVIRLLTNVIVSVKICCNCLSKIFLY